MLSSWSIEDELGKLTVGRMVKGIESESVRVEGSPNLKLAADADLSRKSGKAKGTARTLAPKPFTRKCYDHQSIRAAAPRVWLPNVRLSLALELTTQFGGFRSRDSIAQRQ